MLQTRAVGKCFAGRWAGKRVSGRKHVSGRREGRSQEGEQRQGDRAVARLEVEAGGWPPTPAQYWPSAPLSRRFTTRKGLRVCAEPKEKWVQKYISLLKPWQWLGLLSFSPRTLGPCRWPCRPWQSLEDFSTEGSMGLVEKKRCFHQHFV